jgi:hypothetical protein
MSSASPTCNASVHPSIRAHCRLAQREALVNHLPLPRDLCGLAGARAPLCGAPGRLCRNYDLPGDGSLPRRPPRPGSRCRQRHASRPPYFASCELRRAGPWQATVGNLRSQISHFRSAGGGQVSEALRPGRVEVGRSVSASSMDRDCWRRRPPSPRATVGKLRGRRQQVSFDKLRTGLAVLRPGASPPRSE